VSEEEEEEEEEVNNEPRGGPINDYRKIRILRILQTHTDGLPANRLSKPPGDPSIDGIGLVLRDLLDDGLIEVGEVNDNGVLPYLITELGNTYLGNLEQFRNNNNYLFKIFRGLDGETTYHNENIWMRILDFEKLEYIRLTNFFLKF